VYRGNAVDSNLAKREEADNLLDALGPVAAIALAVDPVP